MTTYPVAWTAAVQPPPYSFRARVRPAVARGADCAREVRRIGRLSRQSLEGLLLDAREAGRGANVELYVDASTHPSIDAHWIAALNRHLRRRGQRLELRFTGALPGDAASERAA